MSIIKVITVAVSLAWAGTEALQTPGIIGFLVRDLAPVVVYDEPRVGAARHRVEKPAVVELGYEVDYGLIVLEERSGWLRIGEKQWVPMKRGEQLRRVEELLGPSESDMRYWIGAAPMPLWSAEARALRVVGLQRRASSVWLEVEVLDRSFCEVGDQSPKVIRRGWVPLKDSAGRLNFWWYTRGC